MISRISLKIDFLNEELKCILQDTDFNISFPNV